MFPPNNADSVIERPIMALEILAAWVVNLLLHFLTCEHEIQIFSDYKTNKTSRPIIQNSRNAAKQN